MPPKAKIISKEIQKSKSDGIILIAKDIFGENSEDKSPCLIRLRHPRTNKAALFLITGDNMIQEVIVFNEENRSWFIDESVRSDGRMVLCTKMNPIYLALPYLFKASRLSPLDQTLIDPEFPEIRNLLKCINSKHLVLVADRKGDEDMNVWKYNEQKTLSWLKSKVDKLDKVLREKNVQIDTEAAVSNTFVKTKAETDCENVKEKYVRYGHGILSEYLPEEISTKLLTHLGLSVIKSNETKKRKSLVPNNDENIKRIKLENQDEMVLDVIKTEKVTPMKPVQLSAKDKALAKSASGTKPISSFFKRASK